MKASVPSIVPIRLPEGEDEICSRPQATNSQRVSRPTNIKSRKRLLCIAGFLLLLSKVIMIIHNGGTVKLPLPPEILPHLRLVTL